MATMASQTPGNKVEWVPGECDTKTWKKLNKDVWRQVDKEGQSTLPEGGNCNYKANGYVDRCPTSTMNPPYCKLVGENYRV